MPVVACPSCASRLRVSPEKLGKLLRCPHCGETFQASEAAAAGPPATAPAAAPGTSAPAGPPTLGYATASAPRAGAGGGATGDPLDWLRALGIGAATGAIAGAILYAPIGLLAAIVWGGPPLVMALIAGIVGAVYYAVLGSTIGVVFGLWRNQAAAYLVAIGFALVGIFFLQGGACSALVTMGFAWLTIAAVRASLDV